MIKRNIVLYLIILAGSFSNFKLLGQEYKYELGAATGTAFYMGDANRTKLFLHPEISVGAFHRYNINLHWAIKNNLIGGRISGDTNDAQNVFPQDFQTAFKRTFFEIGSQIEYNFFPYSDKFSYMDARRYTPYLFAGAGVTVATGENVFCNLNLPIGVGFKYKLKEKVNIGIEFSMRKLFGDDFDVVQKNNKPNLDAPFGIKSSFLKNQDWYSLTLVFITWEFGLKNDPCCGP